MRGAGTGSGSENEPGDLPGIAATAAPADLADTVESSNAGNTAHTLGATDQGSTAGPVGRPGIGGPVPSADPAEQARSVGPAPSIEPVEEWHGPDPRAHRRVPRTVDIASILLVMMLVLDAVTTLVPAARGSQPDIDGEPLGGPVTALVIRLVLFGALLGFLRRGHAWARGCLTVVVSIGAIGGAALLVIAAIAAFRGYSAVGRVELVVRVLLIFGVLRYLIHPETREYFSGRRQFHR